MLSERKGASRQGAAAPSDFFGFFSEIAQHELTFVEGMWYNDENKASARRFQKKEEHHVQESRL
jgi:peptide deformylase